MIVYTVICILYAVYGKECTWMLSEFVEGAKEDNEQMNEYNTSQMNNDQWC